MPYQSSSVRLQQWCDRWILAVRCPATESRPEIASTGKHAIARPRARSDPVAHLLLAEVRLAQGFRAFSLIYILPPNVAPRPNGPACVGPAGEPFATVQAQAGRRPAATARFASSEKKAWNADAEGLRRAASPSQSLSGSSRNFLAKQKFCLTEMRQRSVSENSRNTRSEVGARQLDARREFTV